MCKTSNEIAYTKSNNSTYTQLQQLKLDKTLEKSLVDVLRTQNKRIQRLSDKLFEKKDCLKKEPDIIRLAVIVKCLEKTKAYYAHLKISDDIFYDTMSDVRIWCENNGNKGLNNYRWLTAHIKGELFRLGRLQYQLYTCNNKTLDYTRLPFNRGENVLYIHIPQGEKLNYADCRASICKAKEFFKTYFPDYNYKYFFCESWLLFEGNSAFMKPDSNILQFASLFDISYSVLEDKQAIERIFGKSRQRGIRKILPKSKLSIDAYPETTSLQKAAKKYMQSGNRLGMGIGTIKA